MKQISHLCKKYQIKGELRLPSDDDLTAYFRHFIFDDHRRVIFCFVPKVSDPYLLDFLCVGLFLGHFCTCTH